jgi:AraC-like DNA-binding protein
MPRRDGSADPAAATAAAAARVHLGPIRAVPELLARMGVPWEPVLRHARISRADLEDQELSAPFDRVDRLLGECVERSGCEHFGLLVGQTVDLRSFGIPGRIALSAPTAGDALAALARHFVLHDSGGSPRVAITNGTAVMSYGIHVPGVHNAQQVYDLSVAAMCNVLRQLCGADWRPDAVTLPRKRPPDIGPYREVLQAPLRFDALHAAVVFPSHWLTRRLPDADALLFRLLERRAVQEAADHGPLLCRETCRAIRDLQQDGDCSRAAVAGRLGLHERTLGRRLQAAGTTFRQLLDDTRADVAKQLLHDTRSPIARIAESLGYTDATAFTRAFRGWTGMTPREFRTGSRPAG